MYLLSVILIKNHSLKYSRCCDIYMPWSASKLYSWSALPIFLKVDSMLLEQLHDSEVVIQSPAHI